MMIILIPIIIVSSPSSWYWFSMIPMDSGDSYPFPRFLLVATSWSWSMLPRLCGQAAFEPPSLLGGEHPEVNTFQLCNWNISQHSPLRVLQILDPWIPRNICKIHTSTEPVSEISRHPETFLSCLGMPWRPRRAGAPSSNEGVETLVDWVRMCQMCWICHDSWCAQCTLFCTHAWRIPRALAWMSEVKLEIIPVNFSWQHSFTSEAICSGCSW